MNKNESLKSTFTTDSLSNTQEEKKEKILHEEYRKTNKLQDTTRTIILLLHCYYFSYIYDTWGNSAKIALFLTTITYYLNTIYFILSIGNSIIHKINNSVLVKQFNLNTLFRIGFTTSNVVVILYWGVYMVDPSLLGDKKLPFHFDFFLHGGGLVSLIVDRVVVDQEHRYETRINSKVLLLITVVYFTVIYSIFLTTGLAVYPLLAKLSFIQVFILVIAGYILFLTGNLIYKLLI